MTLQTLTLNQIKPSKDNPRKSFDDDTIAGLAASIKTDGLLQNLIVAKPKGKGKTYTLISGERRFRALTLLAENGDIPKDYKIPVKIEEDLSKDTAQRIAVIENVQRENLNPLEEAEAIVGLLQDEMSIEDISSQTGLSVSTIKRRLALFSLCDEAKTALHNKEISLSQAQALTVGTQKQQIDFMQKSHLSYFDADEIRDYMIVDKACLAHALFDKQLYTGTFSSDLFGDENSTFFDDMEQFWTLQNQAVEGLTHHLEEEGFAPVEIVEGHYRQWQYRETEDGEIGGAIIHVSPSGAVEVYKNLINRDLDENVIEQTQSKPRATYSKPLCEYIAMHKSIAVQAALLENTRIAKELAIVQMLSGHNGVSLHLHQCLAFFADEENTSASFDTLKNALHTALSNAMIIDEEGVSDFMQASYGIGCDTRRSVDYYMSLKHLSNEELDSLHLLLTISCFGQLQCYRLDTQEESLFNLVAKDLKIDMREKWMPDEAFLKRKNLSQLKAIIAESGLTHLFANGEGYKKSMLVRAMADQFKRIRSSQNPYEKEQGAYAWLPEAFAFPAIDPDA